jgi:hypothetical protein
MTMTIATTLAFIQATEQAQRAAVIEMTTGGWVFMAAAWVFILTLVYYTFSKVLRGK